MEVESDYFSLIDSFSKKLPHRSDGKIDYTNAKKAPVVTIFVFHERKILILKRSQKVLTYKGLWNTVAGYLDELKPIKEKIDEELYEELGISINDVNSYHIGNSYIFEDKNINRTWIVFPVIVILDSKPDIKLDWEHTKYTWITPSDITDFDTVPNSAESLKRVLEFI